MEIVSEHFIPWCDGVFLDEESIYALWNKIAWFHGISPVRLARLARLLPKAAVAPKQISYRRAENWIPYLADSAILPRVRDDSARGALVKLHDLSCYEVPDGWSANALRICERCMAQGIHLRIHQHLAVARCPIHDSELRTTCPTCELPLSYTSTTEMAFTCNACRHCFLAKGDIRLGFTNWERAYIKNLCNEVLGWLRPLNADVHRNCDERSLASVDHALVRTGGRPFLLAAIRNSSAQPPTWLMTPESMDGEIRIASIHPYEVARVEAMRKAHLVERWSVCKGSQNQHGGWILSPPDCKRRQKEISKDALDSLNHCYHLAFRRVTAIFLKTAKQLGHDCLESPALITPDEDSLDEAKENDLLGCCPLALGFYLWRKWSRAFYWRSLGMQDSFFRQAGLTEAAENLDLLFYSLERSNLHASIMAAHECSRRWRENGAVADLSWTLWPYGGGWVFHQNPRSEWLDFEGDGQALTFIRVDATQLIHRVTCPGMTPLHESVRRTFRNIKIFNTRALKMETLNKEDLWEEVVKARMAKLKPMEEDVVFFAPSRGRR